MSLNINIDKVTGVLIAGTWYKVANDSFVVDSYEFIDNHDVEYLLGGRDPLVPATGYGFETADGAWMYGPLTAMQGVRQRR